MSAVSLNGIEKPVCEAVKMKPGLPWTEPLNCNLPPQLSVFLCKSCCGQVSLHSKGNPKTVAS